MSFKGTRLDPPDALHHRHSAKSWQGTRGIRPPTMRAINAHKVAGKWFAARVLRATLLDRAKAFATRALRTGENCTCYSRLEGNVVIMLQKEIRHHVACQLAGSRRVVSNVSPKNYTYV